VRLFDPRGTSEDPYTGSASGAMGCFVVRYGLKKGPVLLADEGDFLNRPGEGLIGIKKQP
jgi:trans-2,3-dihydro-3-hydroxyanthranilate isomerase